MHKGKTSNKHIQVRLFNPQYLSDFLGSAEIILNLYECYIIYIHSRVKNTPACLFVVNESRLQWQVHYVFYDMPIIIILLRKILFFKYI